MRIRFRKDKETRSVEEAEEKVNEAIEQRRISEQRLHESIQLRDAMREMRHRNNIGSLLDKLVQHRVDKEQRDT